jgi:hypothetical protein
VFARLYFSPQGSFDTSKKTKNLLKTSKLALGYKLELSDEKTSLVTLSLYICRTDLSLYGCFRSLLLILTVGGVCGGNMCSRKLIRSSSQSDTDTFRADCMKSVQFAVPLPSPTPHTHTRVQRLLCFFEKMLGVHSL